MPRSRSRRRRQGVLVLSAILASVVVIALVHDVNRIAARSVANRTSLNRTFGSLATDILADEDAYGARVSTLFAGAPSLSRTQFAAQVTRARLDGSDLVQRVSILEHPTLAHHVQQTLISVTNQRVQAVTGLLNWVGTRLQLPGSLGPTVSPNQALGQFRLSDAVWKAARFSLRTEPGRVQLPPSIFALTGAPLNAEWSTIAGTASLRAHRAMSIAAVSISPASLPAPGGHLEMLASNDVVIGVSVRNLAYVEQHFVLSFTLTPSSGSDVVHFSVSEVVGPDASRAINFPSFALTPNERGNVNIVLHGVPVAANGSGARHYQLTVASSPTK